MKLHPWNMMPNYVVVHGHCISLIYYITLHLFDFNRLSWEFFMIESWQDTIYIHTEFSLDFSEKENYKILFCINPWKLCFKSNFE